MVAATAMAVLFLVLVLLESFGYLANPYLGLLVFVLVPVLFVAGLALVPIGVWLASRRRQRGLAPAEWPVIDLRDARQRGIGAAVLGLTAVNVGIVTLGAYGGVHYMESAAFCGQVCHTTMEPQAVAHRAFPHAAVACAQCHVGPGAGAFVQGKLAGTRQLLDVMTNRVPTPVPPPSDLLQPAGVTCEQCHSRATRSGDVLKVGSEFANDEANTESTTTLRLHVGDARAGIHRHLAMDIEYVAADEARTSIPVVRVRDGRGGVREYVTAGVRPDVAGVTRRMACTDCHNRPAHTFWFTPERAVDAAIAKGELPRALPFVRREAVAAVSEAYANREAALDAIARRLGAFYDSRPVTDRTAVSRAVTATQGVWARNVFPLMKVTWGTYPNHLGHIDSPGCFRCHDDEHKAADGAAIKQDCELCHTLPE
jgi:hypothetical protein